MKYGIRLPNGDVHECPQGLEQALRVVGIRDRNGFDSEAVSSENGLQWEPVGA